MITMEGWWECVGGWVTKIATEKIELTFSIFFAAIFVIQFPPIAIAGPSNSRYCVFVQHFWEFKIFKNVWRRRNIVNSRILWLWLVGGGSGWRKLRPKKIGDDEVDRLFFDIYRHLANQMTKPIGLIRRDKAAWLIVHTWTFKLLNQAAGQSCSTNLVGQLVLWTLLKLSAATTNIPKFLFLCQIEVANKLWAA